MGVFGLALCGAISLVLPPPANPLSPHGVSIEARLPVPPSTLAVLRRACYDCHSNETRWPIYSRLWPASAMMFSDVTRARATMNFSQWPEPTEPRRAAGLLMASCAAMQSGLMPRRQYLLLHPEAKVSKEEAAQYCAWSTSEVRKLHK